MEFLQFAAIHGLDIRRLEHGKISRCPTKDHPRKDNGAYLFDGDWGWCQNWAEMTEPVYWTDDTITKPEDLAALRIKMERSRKLHAQERAKDAAIASKRAQTIVSAAVPEPHAYLDSKGWRDTGLVWYPSEGVNLLVIPMRAGNAIVGCQLIDRDGNKRFLKGQKTSGAEYVFGARGVDVWCEGYATARSISECLALAGLPARVHACFSAGNLQRMAKTGVVVADNDPGSCAGIKAAKSTGLPYWVSDSPGEDFNDYHAAVGTFAAGMGLRKWLQKAVRTGQ